jgi:RNA polymerase sigma factor (sigma-70 family)
MAALLTLFRRAARVAAEAPDAELLARFADRRDEEAFAELVRRHGPVVYRVCARLVGPTAAEDAFQAVFLVLATRLKAARAAPALAGWLVGVAGRVARQMRRSAARRARHEQAAAESRPGAKEEPAAELADQFRALDEELAALPDRLRDPVVLCLLNGRTQEQAAAELGRDPRTLRRRLERAKQVLRARLERRGVVPAVAAALAVGAGAVSAGVPAGLDRRAVTTVFDFLTGGAKASPPVILAKGVATTMLTRKLTLALAATAAGVITLSAVLAGDGPPAAAPAPPTAAAAPRVAPAPVPKPAPRPAPLHTASTVPEIDWAKDEARAREQLAGIRRNVEAGETVVLISAMCVRVPAGFCERAGLTEEEAAKDVWTLTTRERRMLSALLGAEPGKEIVTRPMITAIDGERAIAQVGQQREVVTGFDAETKDGKAVYTPKLSKVDVGFTLKVTTKVGAGGLIRLQVEAERSELGGLVRLGGDGPGAELYAPAVNKQASQATVILPDGGTTVIRSVVSRQEGKVIVQHELLWVLTAHAVRKGKDGMPAADSGAQRPVAVPPPLKP